MFFDCSCRSPATQQRFAAQLRIVGLRRDALVLAGGARHLPALPIDERDLLRRFALQLMLRIRATKRVEHVGRCSPVLEPNERCAGVVFRGGANLRRRRRLLDAQEVIRGCAIVL